MNTTGRKPHKAVSHTDSHETLRFAVKWLYELCFTRQKCPAMNGGARRYAPRKTGT